MNGVLDRGGGGGERQRVRDEARLAIGEGVGGSCLGSRSEHMIKIDTIGRTGHFEGSRRLSE